MTIRKKTLLIISISCVIFLAFLYISANTVLKSYIDELESKELRNQTGLMFKIIGKDTATLKASGYDWAQWDDTYDYIQDQNKKYKESNLVESTLVNLKLDFMVFIDQSSRQIFAMTQTPENQFEEELPPGLDLYIKPGSPLLTHESSGDHVTGIILIEERLAMISSCPITKSDTSGGIKGSVIMGRFMDEAYIRELEDMIGAKIIVQLKDSSDGFIRPDNKIPVLTMDKTGVAVNRVNGHMIEANTYINDFAGDRVALASLQMPRLIYRQGYKAFTVFAILFAVCVIFYVAAVMLVTQKTILSRIQRLDGFINRVDLQGGAPGSINLNGSDEISSLATAVNKMLERINGMNAALVEREERLKLVLEGTNDGYWDLDIASKKAYLSSRAREILGCSMYSGELSFELLRKLIHEDALERLTRLYCDNLQGKTEQFRAELQISQEENGRLTWLLFRGKVVNRDESGNALRMAGTVSDITEQKNAEEEIRYLSFNDPLTGLSNRVHFEECIKEMNTDRNLPLSVIWGDVNGLKLANDSFGHIEGDRLLMKIGKIMKNVSRRNDLVARIGGDEFVIVLPNTGEAEALDICEMIQKHCTEDSGLVKPSIALGAASKKQSDEALDKLLETAETRMYRNKLIEDKSSRHATIASMQRALSETSFETEEHAKRLGHLALKLGRELKLPNSQLDELSLLATLHDIGKIAVSREILNKPDKLTSEEWEHIKNHPEIGYRIAISSYELATVADGILAHHEKWDGSGYPKGLRGASIPFISRIIAIVDAYDVMTHERPYKKAYSTEEAVKELERCAGSHFDPVLVDAFVKIIIELDQQEENCA